MALLKAGRLTPRLSDQEALGNYVDRQVRRNLRSRFAQLGIDPAGAGPVRVNRRENISSGSDLTYRRPEARVNDVAFDVTLTRKILGTPQVRGFFDADFRPSSVVIIRPRPDRRGPYLCHSTPRDETMSGPNAYFPASLSEINDLLGSMILDAPKVVDSLGDFPDRNIDSEFDVLTEGFGAVRKKLGEERFAALIDLAARA